MRISRVIIPMILFFAVFAYKTAGAQHDPVALFYFNPDSPQNNLSRLKRNMDDLLSSAGIPISFQPFTHLVDLEDRLEEKPPAFLFVPRWYFEKHGAAYHLHPVLIPVRKGMASYRKVLLGMKKTSRQGIRKPHVTVAMTSMGPDEDKTLESILFSQDGLADRNVNAIIVPKDADALFALALGQVDMALVVKENLALIAKINPNILQSVQPLLESKPIPMPLLCYTEGVASPSAVQELKRLFLEGEARKGYTTIMEMLQINGWQAVQP
jgi:hypothetical protein